MTPRARPRPPRASYAARVLAVLALLAVGAALLTGCVVDGAPAGGDREPGGAGSFGRGDVSPGAVEETGRRLTGLRVVPERPNLPGYDRDCGPGDGCVFGTDWSDDTDAPQGRNGCDTRNDVLGASLDDVRFEAGTRGCDVVAGLLRDPYTGAAIDYATRGSEIHIDHLVPLAAAWDLGASTWPPTRRATFANDAERELLAVSGGANLAKSDSTPGDWLPPDEGARCGYVVAYVDVVAHYDLALTVGDVAAIEDVLATSC